MSQPDPIIQRAALHAAIWSDNPTVAYELHRVLHELCIPLQLHLQGKRRMMRRLWRRRFRQDMQNLMVMGRLAHADEMGRSPKKVS